MTRRFTFSIQEGVTAERTYRFNFNPRGVRTSAIRALTTPVPMGEHRRRGRLVGRSTPTIPSMLGRLLRWVQRIIIATVVVAVVLVGLCGVFGIVNPITHCGDMRRTKALADIRGINEALHEFKWNCGRYPRTEEGLEVLIVNSTRTPACPSYRPDGYLDKMPIDPWGNRHVYSSDEQTFMLQPTFGHRA